MTDLSRRTLLERSAAVAAGVAATTLFPHQLTAAMSTPASDRSVPPARLRFAVIGMNHGHIYGQVDATVRGGGELVSFYAREPALAAEFARRYPAAKQVGDERAILEDPTIQLVVSASIPNERAPLGIRVMQHGKDFLADKPYFMGDTPTEIDAVAYGLLPNIMNVPLASSGKNTTQVIASISICARRPAPRRSAMNTRHAEVNPNAA